MFDSIALEVTIGLIFIFLLYSLLATVICEIISIHLGLRARNLQWAIKRMLEDSAVTSETKLKALINHILSNIIQFFKPDDGPASCVFYHLPVIKYLARNSFYSKPSYITRQNFSKALIEIFRRYGGDGEKKTDLEKIQTVVNGLLVHDGILEDINQVIQNEISNRHPKVLLDADFFSVRLKITNVIINATSEHINDPAQKRIFNKIKGLLSKDIEKLKDKAKDPEFKIEDEAKRTENDKKKDKEVVYQIIQLINLFGLETRSHLKSLLKDANNDLTKFRLLLEQWFDDTMERATGWYKQKVQFVLLLVGLFLAVAFNASTLQILRILSKDKDSREQLVRLASPVDTATNHRLWKERMDSLDKVRVQLQEDIEEANSLLGLGWHLPDSLALYRLNMYDTLVRLKNKEIKVIPILLRTEVRPIASGKDTTNKAADTSRSATDATAKKAETTKQAGDTAKKNLKVFVFTRKLIAVPQSLSDDILKYLPAGENDTIYTGYNASITKIKVDNNWWDHFTLALRNFIRHFWGYLLTAIAISMGAPFWFDILSKLMRVRGTEKEPIKDGSSASALPTSDPAHPLNRKG
jgi:hypothetical protein